jgi:hypothetical protein
MHIYQLVLEVENGFYAKKYRTRVLFLAENEEEADKKAEEWWKRHEKMDQGMLFTFGGFGDKPLKFAGTVQMQSCDGGFLA